MEWEGEKVSLERKIMNRLGIVSILQLTLTVLYSIFGEVWWAEAVIIICTSLDFFNFGVAYNEWVISEGYKGRR